VERIPEQLQQRATEVLAANLAAGKGEKREIKKIPAHPERFS